MDLKLIDEVLRILVSPTTFGSGGLEDAFRSNIERVASLVKSSEKFSFICDALKDDVLSVKSDVTWQFVQFNLRLLLLLHDAINDLDCREDTAAGLDVGSAAEKIPKLASSAPSLPSNALSVAQVKTIATSLQFIICFGICRYLLPGVGLPLTQRTEFGGLISVTESPCSLSRDEMDSRLLECTRMLLKCTDGLSSEAFNQVIVGKHLGDVLAALFQVCHTMMQRAAVVEAKKVEFGVLNCDVDIPPLVEKDCYQVEKCISSRRPFVSDKRFSEVNTEFYAAKLEFLLEKSNQSSVIQHLLLLQNGSPPSSKVKSENVKLECVSPPVWLKKLTRKYLVRAFVRPHGIESLFAVLLQGANANEHVAEWKRYEAVAKIVVECPLGNVIPLEDYYHRISGQILTLLYSSVKHVGRNSLTNHLRQCVRAAVHMMSMMIVPQPLLTQKYLTGVLLEPMLSCMEMHDKTELRYLNDVVHSPISEFQSVVVAEKALTNCLEAVHLMLTESSVIGDDLGVVMHSVLDFLVHLYCHVQTSVTHLRKKIEEIVHWIFQRLDLSLALNFLRQFCLRTSASSDFPKMKPDLGFCGGENGGICVVVQTEKKFVLDITRWEHFAGSIVHLIISAKRQDDLGVELFLVCLKALTDILSKEFDSISPVSVPLGRCDDGAMPGIIELNLTVLSLIAALCDKIGPSCLKKPLHIVEFVEATLTRGTKILQVTNDAAFGAFETETLTLALGLLTSVLAAKEKLSNLDWTKFQTLQPLLQQLSEVDIDASLQEMALDLRIAIATHGLVQTRGNKSSSGVTNVADIRMSKVSCNNATHKDVENVDCLSSKSVQKSRPLIEVLESKDVDSSTSPVERKDLEDSQSRSNPVRLETPSDPESSPSQYQQAMEELCDSSVPVRGHGLIALHRLITQRDSETLANSEMILDVCCLNLNHMDSYIYLSAIRAMASLAERFPKFVIARLATEYSLGLKETKRTPELQMKLGEVLVKVSSGLGETLPYYRDDLLSAVLSAAKDSDALVRASAISNLGEICRLLRFSLGNVIQEIFSCIENVLKSDGSVEVRRSAAMFSTLLFRGLSKDTFAVLGKSLVEFYRVLKYIRSTERDDIVQHHIQLSFDELGLIVRNYLTPSEKPTKRIQILGPFE